MQRCNLLRMSLLLLSAYVNLASGRSRWEWTTTPPQRRIGGTDAARERRTCAKLPTHDQIGNNTPLLRTPTYTLQLSL